MRYQSIRFAIPAALVALVACGNQTDDARSNVEQTATLSATTLGTQQILTSVEYLASEPYSGANSKNGERQAQICKACHSLESDGTDMIGPALHGIFGRRVADRDGFDYSQAMRGADFVWTPRALDAWLAQPGSFMPGNRMTFAGVFRQRDRDDLLAYLLTATTVSVGEHGQ